MNVFSSSCFNILYVIHTLLNVHLTFQAHFFLNVRYVLQRLSDFLTVRVIETVHST